MTEKLIVVVGATGSQGGAIARDFAQKPGWKVRGLTRDPSRASNQWLKDLGVELVQGNLDDPASLDAAFTNAAVIFGVTDFWQFWGDAAAQDLAARAQIPMNVACMRREVAQGRNIADAAARVLREQGTLERYVWSTLSDTLKWTGGEITENYHFDGKVEVEKHIRNDLTDLAARTSYLMVGFYTSNWKNMSAFGPQKQPDGTWVHTTLHLPGHSEARLPIVLPPKDTGIFVEGLLAAPAQTTLLAFTEFATVSDFAAAWSRATGAPCRVERTSPEAVLAADSSALAREVVASKTYAAKWRYEGYAPDLKHPRDIGIDVARLTTLEQYMQGEDWSEVLRAGGVK